MKRISLKISIVVFGIVLGVSAALILTSAFHITKVQGQTMSPSLPDNSYAVVNKWAYLFQTPKEGDVVAFPCDVYSEDGEGPILLKRVVATAGDVVEIKDGSLYVNNRIYDKYALEAVHMESIEKVTIENNKVFVLSDNRDAVLDSRDQAVGQLLDTEIIGKVCFK